MVDVPTGVGAIHVGVLDLHRDAQEVDTGTSPATFQGRGRATAGEGVESTQPPRTPASYSFDQGIEVAQPQVDLRWAV